MSEISSRPPGHRGRGSARGGRGGYSSRGRGGRATNGKTDALNASNFKEEGEIGELKSRYNSQLGTVREMFPHWTDEDLVYALNETDGDLESTIERIAEGNMPQWGEVKKKNKDRSQPKQVKEVGAVPADASAPSLRGGRGRGGIDAARGGRSRGLDRGRGGTRGGRGARAPSSAKVNGLAADAVAKDAPQTAGGWESTTTDTGSSQIDSSWENVTADQAQPPMQEEVKTSAKSEAPKSWAAMFAKPKPASAPKAPKTVAPNDATEEPILATTPPPADGSMQGLPPVVTQEPPEAPMTPPTSDSTLEQAVDLTPPKDDLTENNLEKLPDESGAHISATAASTAASTIDQRVISGTALGPSQKKSARPPLGGYATSAYKATGMPGRTASYQRKILEQQEAVVMPGKHGVDKAAVQFGSMGLNGAPEDVDVDSDREDPETRVQPPQHSPVAPRASLPPAPEQKQGLPPSQQHVDAQPAPRQAPGLPPVQQPSTSHQPPSSSAPEAQIPSQAYQYNQYMDRFGQPPSSQSEATAPPQKPHEPFGQQLQQSQPSQHYDPFNHSQYGGPNAEARQYLESKTSGAGNMSSYYTSDEQRNPYQNGQYGGYGQQQSGPDSAPSQQRSSSAIGSSAPNQPTQHATAHGRFGQGAEAQGSGQSTPYGSMPTPQPANHPQGSGPGQHGYGGYNGYPYGGYYPSSYNMSQMGNHAYGRERPGFDESRRYEDAYLSQGAGYGYGGQGGYGGGHFGGAGGKSLYGQQHPGYGMSPQTSHEQHSSSPAAAGAFGHQIPTSGRDSAVGGLSGYGARSGSTQPSDNQHPGHQSNMDVFGRSSSNYQAASQNQSNDDQLRGYGDSKVPGGPSPAVGQSAGRPGSTINPQTGLPPQDARFSQGGYGGYPGQSQYGGGPAAGSHGSGAQQQQYGGYGVGGYGGSYYGSNQRGGWGASYGH